jgi:hypothetical protein
VANSNTLSNADIISYIDNLDNLCQAGDSFHWRKGLTLRYPTRRR